MPNYSLVIDSKFKPFSYQELAAPLDRQELYHEKLAEEYDNLSKQADVLEIMAGNEQDKNSGSYSRYKSYSDALRKEADNLYQFGLNTESRRRLTDLRRRYNTDIVPIQNAWSKREKEADEQMKASLQNPSIMFTRDARSTSLDDYIKNPTGGYGVINGANITAQMAGMAKNLEKQILSGSARKENIDPYTYDYIRKYGLTADMVRDWRDNPTLSKMFEQVMQANGVTPEALNGSLNAQSIIDKSTGYAEMGMWNAIGEDRAQVIENYGARLAAQEAKEKRVKKYEHNLNQPQPTYSGTMSDSLYQLPMSGADYSNAGEQKRAMQYLGYTNKDGKLVFSGKVSLSPNGDSRARTNRILELNQKEIEQGMLTAAEKNERSRLTAEQRFNYSKSKEKKEYKLYDGKGNLLSRKQFVSQAKTTQEKSMLQQYYSNVEEANQTLGVNGNYNHRDLTKHYNTLRQNNAAQMANVRPLNYESADWNPTAKQFQVRKIKGYKKGKPIYSTETISLGELLDRKDSNQNNIVAAPYWSEVKGQEGLIFATTEDSKQQRYFTSADDMPESNVQRARYYFNIANQYARRGNTNEAKLALEIAYRALHTGLTMHNKSYEQSMVRQPTLKQQGLTNE